MRDLTLRPGLIAGLFAGFLLSACGAVMDSVDMRADGAVQPFEGPVPKAECGPGSSEETALQGQVSKQDRLSGRSRSGYNCNLEQIGQFAGDGASWQFTWFEDCGYYDTKDENNAARPAAIIGSVVIDGTDPTQPVASKYLQTRAMLDPWESIKVNDKRELLAAIENRQQNMASLDVYDISSDCRQPELLFAGVLGGNGHAGDWALNGHTYYGAAIRNNPTAYDMRDPANPVVLASPTNFPAGHGTHDLNTNDDGTRLYFAELTAGNGLTILDVTQIEQQVPEPQINVVSELYWTDGSGAQQTLHVVINGTPYILFVDEGGLGAARLIDISNEAAPFIASKLKLEVHMPENSSAIQGDTATGGGTFGYQGHYCGVDDPHDTTTIACGYFQSGIRVFDVRDPYSPREIAYFHPELQSFGTPMLGSQNNRATTASYCSAQVRLIPERGELWTTCQDHGFLALKFTNGVWPFVD